MATLITFPPSYLYSQYYDDPDLQALVKSQNIYAQSYLDTMMGLNLPIYTGGSISGALLDWVGEGIYGIARPYFLMQNTQAAYSGTYNGVPFNQLPYNAFEALKPSTYSPVTDDVYKRVITWSFFKGDGKLFDVRWLKRRVMRFLFGTAGVNPPVNQTYPISILFGANNQITIRIVTGIRRVVGGALYNLHGFNQVPFNSVKSVFIPFPPVLNADILKQAIEGNILPLPFQYQYSVQIG